MTVGAGTRTVGFGEDTTVLSLYKVDADLKRHPRYAKAKAGDPAAALELVTDLALPWLFDLEGRLAKGAVYVAPHAKEASGDNAIPQTLAAVCALVFDGAVDKDIVQTDRVYHTGANAMERMASRATFEGDVVAGQQYVLVDDVTNLGGTLAELNDFVVARAGVVQAVIVLANAGRNPSLIPAAKDIRLIKERFGNDIIEVFGIAPDALTANEARYLVGFRSADEIRDCLAKARQENDRRLRAKGISRPGGAAESSQAGPQLSAAALNLPPAST